MSQHNSLAKAARAAPEAPPADTKLQLGQAGLQLLYVNPDIHGNFSPEIVEQVRRLRQDRCYVVLAFPPKCGGTFIREVVGRLSGAGPSPVRLGHALGGRDVSPYLPLLALQMMSPTGPKAFMTHAHMIAYQSNVQLLNLFGMKPVVMKRSIPDMLCSFADMAQTEGLKGGAYNSSLLCAVHTDASFLALDAQARLDFLVFHQAPWYFQFYASWLRAHRTGQIPVHWTDYDGFRADPRRTISGILEYYGLKDRLSAVPQALAHAQANKASLRFNKGVSGRGAQTLNTDHMRHLHRLAAGYADIDFVAEGLLPALAS
jgi:hypothetical protein